MFFLLFLCVASKRHIEWSSNDISFIRELQGSGLKQELYTSIHLSKPMRCVLHEIISKDWFIDKEELPKARKFLFSSKIDIELPSSLSTSHKFDIPFNSSFELTYPIHLRYNDCSDSGGYKEVNLPSPSIECEGIFYELSENLSGKVPIGNLNDSFLVISTTSIAALAAVTWIILTIHNLNKKHLA